MDYFYCFGILIVNVCLAFSINYVLVYFKNDGQVGTKAVLKKTAGWIIGLLLVCMFIFFRFGLKTHMLFGLISESDSVMHIYFIMMLILISAIDIRDKIIPNILTLLLLISQIAARFTFSNGNFDWLNIVISAIVLGVLILISKISKEQIGMGDVKLIVVGNLIYNLSITTYSLIIAMIMMILVSIPLLIKKKINMKSPIPFAPFYTAAIGLFLHVVHYWL